MSTRSDFVSLGDAQKSVSHGKYTTWWWIIGGSIVVTGGIVATVLIIRAVHKKPVASSLAQRIIPKKIIIPRPKPAVAPIDLSKDVDKFHL